MNIVLFCGGRGNSNLIKKLSEMTSVNLTLIVNAYDNGLSTGAIRRLVPGMLGPSDFRKNLSNLLIPASESHICFQQILEHRLKISDSLDRNMSGMRFLNASNFRYPLTSKLISHDQVLKGLFRPLPKRQSSSIYSLVECFLKTVHPTKVEEAVKYKQFDDFAFGNMLLAGAYISEGASFSGAIDKLSRIYDTSAKILNVADKNLFLVGITDKGEYISDEGDLVAGQFEGKIQEIFLLEEPLTREQIESYETLASIGEKICFLKALEVYPEVNPMVIKSLNDANLVILGSGTQHSSLFPTYKILSKNQLAIEALEKVPCVMVSNLDYDLDIQGWSGEDLVQAFEKYWGLEEASDIIDVIISDIQSPFDFSIENKELEVLIRNVRSGSNTNAHDGTKLAKTIFESFSFFSQENCDFRVFAPSPNLSGSRLARNAREYDFSHVEFEIDCKVSECPNPSERAVEEYNRWIIDDGGSRFLVLYACEGETNFEDLVAGLTLLKSSEFTVMSGSRTQSRRQWIKTTGKTYGEGFFRFNLSLLAATLAVFISVIRRNQLLTDPLSRCLVIDRRALLFSNGVLGVYRGKTIPGLRTFLLTKGLDIGEFPIRYRVYRGYRSFYQPTIEAVKGFFEIMKLPK